MRWVEAPTKEVQQKNAWDDAKVQGFSRVKRKFLFFPKRLANVFNQREWRWLEEAQIIEVWSCTYFDRSDPIQPRVRLKDEYKPQFTQDWREDQWAD